MGKFYGPVLKQPTSLLPPFHWLEHLGDWQILAVGFLPRGCFKVHSRVKGLFLEGGQALGFFDNRFPQKCSRLLIHLLTVPYANHYIYFVLHIGLKSASYLHFFTPMPFSQKNGGVGWEKSILNLILISLFILHLGSRSCQIFHSFITLRFYTLTSITFYKRIHFFL